MTHDIRRAGMAAVIALVVCLPGHAAKASNFVFPNGDFGFLLGSSGGVVNPGVIVGFDPQPDPPSASQLSLDLGAPARPVLVNSAQSPGFRFLIGLVLPADLSAEAQRPTPPLPDLFGRTEFDIVIGDGASRHVFTVSLQIQGETPIDPTTWAALNPQPLPPRVAGAAIEFIFEAVGDPLAAFGVTEDGAPLTFALVPVPEPATLSLLGGGLLGIVLLGRRRPSRDRLSLA